MISVIIPVYNTAAYLREALDSVLAQTYKAWECICVDDGSTDGSGDILSEYAGRDSRFVVIRQDNAGQSVARNTALRHVKGDYIYMMDSDDVLEDTLLEEALSRAESTKADIVFFNASVMGDEAWSDYRMAAGWPEAVMTGTQVMRQAMQRRTYRCCVWLMLIKAPLTVCFYPGIIHEDELFAARLYESKSRVVALDRQLVRHRVRSGSTMKRAFSLRNVDCYVTVCRELISTQLPVLQEMARYIIPVIFRTSATIPLMQKPRAFMHMSRAGWLRYTPLKVIVAFWLRS